MTHEESFQVFEQEPDHHFRTELPNIVFKLNLSPSEFLLYSYYKKIAGDKGCCFQSRTKIQKETGISITTQKEVDKALRKSREELGGKSLIRSFKTKKEDGSQGTNQVMIVNIWRENGDYYRNQKNIKTGQNLTGVGQNLTGGGSESDPKEEPIKKNPIRSPYGSIGDKPPSVSKKENLKRPQKKKRALHVATTDDEHQRLQKDFGINETAEAYKILSEWKQDTPKNRWKKCDNRSIRRWVIDSMKQKPSGNKKVDNTNPCLSAEAKEQYNDLEW